MVGKRRKKRVLFRRKRTLDPNTSIDYKDPDQLKRFITDRGKIIPRRISGATAAQQRMICTSVKRARYLALLPYSVAHRQEKNFVVEAALAAAAASVRGDRRPRPPMDRDRDRDSSSAAPAAAPAAAAPEAKEAKPSVETSTPNK